MIRQYTGSDKIFLECCNRADVKPTHRQWRKWNQQRGKAYALKVEVLQDRRFTS